MPFSSHHAIVPSKSSGNSIFGGYSLGQPIEMAMTGLWVVKRGGFLMALGGRDHWDSLTALEADAKAAGLPLSDIAIHTGAPP